MNEQLKQLLHNRIDKALAELEQYQTGYTVYDIKLIAYPASANPDRAEIAQHAWVAQIVNCKLDLSGEWVVDDAWGEHKFIKNEDAPKES